MKIVTGAMPSIEETTLEKENRRIAYQAAVESIVLLENNGVLPLTVSKIALFGAGAKHTIKGGTGSGEVNERYSVSIYDGLKNAGFEITTDAWLNEYDELLAKTKSQYGIDCRAAAAKAETLAQLMDVTSFLFNFPKVEQLRLKIAEKKIRLYISSHVKQARQMTRNLKTEILT